MIIGALAAAGCAPADGTSDAGALRASAGEEVAQIEQAGVFDFIPPGVRKLAGQADSVVGVFGKIKSGFDALQTLGELFGFLDAAPDPFVELTSQLNTGILALSWQSTLQYVDTARSHTNNAMGALRDQTSFPVDPRSPAGVDMDSRSRMATTLMGIDPTGEANLQNSGFLRVHNEAATNGPWKDIIPDRAGTTPKPDNPSTLLVYDWRLGVPAFADIVAKRIAIIGASDPQFATSAHKAELARLRAALQGHMRKMKDGVKCGYRFVSTSHFGIPPIKEPAVPPVNDTIQVGWAREIQHVRYKAQIACADIYTGLSFFTEQTWPDADRECTTCTTTGGRQPVTTCTMDNACVNQKRSTAIAKINTAKDAFRREIYQAMPLFELQSIVDKLYFYARSSLDLTELHGQIPLQAQPPHLCLDTGSSPSNSWTGAPVKVEHCSYSNEQWWSYDRPSGKIRNVPHGVCLEVPAASDIVLDQIFPGVVAHAASCASVTRQRWSYDAESGLLRSAQGTVLDVQNGVVQAGQLLAMSDPTAAQKWRADQPFSVLPAAPTACGRLLPGEGLGIGQSLTSCDGRFTLRLDTSGDLLLLQAASVLWRSGTAGRLGNALVQQGDGNLVLYNSIGGSVWHSNTWNRPGAVSYVQNDGNFVLYDTSGVARWDTKTCCR